MSALKFAFSLELYKARKALHYTQMLVAEAACISVRWYQRIEGGHSLPGPAVMLRLMIVLHIDAQLFRDAVGLAPYIIPGSRFAASSKPLNPMEIPLNGAGSQPQLPQLF